jgi:LysR family transcriptional activator of nhaA
MHLNFHHLQYFWAVAKDGKLTRTAARLRVSPSALSLQIRQLETELGTTLFRRESRQLVLTEAGRMVAAHAERIFSAGEQLVGMLERGRSREEILRIGAVATLSRNVQESFLTPLLNEPDVRMRLVSGSTSELLDRLARHDLDLVLANRAFRSEPGRPWRSRRIASQGVSIVGHRRAKGFRFPDDIGTTPMILPGPDSEIRTEFDALCEQYGLRASIVVEVDDMATLRLLARDSQAVALVPSVVVRDELLAGEIVEFCTVPGLRETFYAITVERQFPHPLVARLLSRDEGEILGMDKKQRPRRPRKAD